jgi:hypothetical protein
MRFSEADLEAAIINQIEPFLLELGKGFLFEARQKRFTFDDEHPAQRRKHPRPGIPTLFAKQGRATAEAGGMDGGFTASPASGC